MIAALWWGLPVLAGVLLAFLGEPFAKRHPLVGCWFNAILGSVLAAGAAANAVLGSWGWAALEAVLALGCAAAWLKYRNRRKQAKGEQ